MFAAFPTQDRDGLEGEVAEIYLMAIQGYADDQVERAVRNFIQGEVKDHNKRFLPTPAEFATEVRRLYERHRQFVDREARIEQQVLPPPPQPPEEVRRKYIIEALGYDPLDRRARDRARQQAETDEFFKQHGIPAEVAKSMDDNELLKTCIDKSKPWHRPMTGEPGRRTPDQLAADSIPMDKK